jgi:hypothetical protein
MKREAARPEINRKQRGAGFETGQDCVIEGKYSDHNDNCHNQIKSQ